MHPQPPAFAGATVKDGWYLTRADPGATSRRGHNRWRSDKPIRQARPNTHTGLSKTPVAMISHCAQIATLPMA
jgi:hypothetical protein